MRTATPTRFRVRPLETTEMPAGQAVYGQLRESCLTVWKAATSSNGVQTRGRATAAQSPPFHADHHAMPSGWTECFSANTGRPASSELDAGDRLRLCHRHMFPVCRPFVDVVPFGDHHVNDVSRRRRCCCCCEKALPRRRAANNRHG